MISQRGDIGTYKQCIFKVFGLSWCWRIAIIRQFEYVTGNSNKTFVIPSSHSSESLCHVTFALKGWKNVHVNFYFFIETTQVKPSHTAIAHKLNREVPNEIFKVRIYFGVQWTQYIRFNIQYIFDSGKALFIMFTNSVCEFSFPELPATFFWYFEFSFVFNPNYHWALLTNLQYYFHHCLRIFKFHLIWVFPLYRFLWCTSDS